MADILQIFSQTADGVFAVDEEQRIILWNDAAHDLLGYTADEVMGQPCYELIQAVTTRGSWFAKITVGSSPPSGPERR